jgi:hypothetical protein
MFIFLKKIILRVFWEKKKNKTKQEKTNVAHVISFSSFFAANY